jgi:hypothetical protein
MVSFSESLLAAREMEEKPTITKSEKQKKARPLLAEMMIFFRTKLASPFPFLQYSITPVLLFPIL